MVCGLASHTSLGNSPVVHPSFPPPFQMRLLTRSDYIGFVLWVLLRFQAFGLPTFPLIYIFQTFDFMLSLYISYVYFIYWISSMYVDFQIFINGDFRNYYLSYYFYYYFKVTGVTILVSELFIYRNILLCKSGCHNNLLGLEPQRWIMSSDIPTLSPVDHSTRLVVVFRRWLRLVRLLSLMTHVLHLRTIYKASTPWTGWHRTRHDGKALLR